MKKDKVTAIRINKTVLDRLKRDGKTPQQIVDEYIEASYEIEETIKIKAK